MKPETSICNKNQNSTRSMEVKQFIKILIIPNLLNI